MPKTNLLYVITKLELGGAQKQLLSLITHLDKDRYSLFLFTACDGFLADAFLSVPGLKIKRSRFLERPLNPCKDFLAFCQIYNYIKRNKIDIVHTHSSKAGILGRWAARLAGVKVIVHTVHGWSFNDYQVFFYRALFLWLERLAAHFTHKLIVVSEHDKQKGLANRIGNEKKYAIINYGIDYEEFTTQGASIRSQLGINTGDLVVGMISCFKAQKAPQDFIKLASLIHKRLPQVKFLLVGDGILRQDLERSILELGLGSQVILTGWRKDIPRVLQAMDVFVLTSLWEGMPISVLEAMVSSCPVVATNTGSISEVISEGKTGFLVAPGDMLSMSEKAIILLNSRDLRKEIGRQAKDSLGLNFTLTRMIKDSQELYKSIENN
ncbi:MAG: glycosyltransferase family 4 protein [Candidatus Omnitrophica bacterium]|nr:glycosyltransferase family 4 protein [Candidatus Omnitrophota bacterium]